MISYRDPNKTIQNKLLEAKEAVDFAKREHIRFAALVPVYKEYLSTFMEPLNFIEPLHDVTKDYHYVNFNTHYTSNIPDIHIILYSWDTCMIRQYIAYLAQQGYYTTQVDEDAQGDIDLHYHMSTPSCHIRISFDGKADCIIEETTVTKTIRRCANAGKGRDY